MPEPEDTTTAEGVHSLPSASSDAVRYVLVEPQLGDNVGAAARALKNLGFARLVVVSPACDPRGDDARRLARDAADILENALVVDDLDAALEGATSVVGTSRRRGKHRRPHWSLDRLAPEMAGMAAVGELAVLFGREAHGLFDAELDRCTHLVHFPSSQAYPSFNLAQSVLLVAYEMRLALAIDLDEKPDEPPADHRQREAMYAHLQAALQAIGFLHDDTVEPMMRKIRRMLGRASLTATEARVFRGIARQTLWMSRQAGLPTPQEPDDDP
jgi:TrmH family RNA methyltransferase